MACFLFCLVHPRAWSTLQSRFWHHGPAITGVRKGFALPCPLDELWAGGCKDKGYHPRPESSGPPTGQIR